MTILALDIGNKRTGVAISHGIIAEGICSISGGELGIDELRKIIENDKVDQIVVGLPLGSNGQDTEQSRIISKIAEKIVQRFSIPVDFVEESYSSTEAEMSLAGKFDRKSGKVDEESARIILEQYLNERRNPSL